MKIALAVVGGFVTVAGAILVYWWSSFDYTKCTGDECALEWSAVLSGAIIAGSIAGVACGFVTHKVSKTRRHR